MLPGSDDELPETSSGAMLLDDVFLPLNARTGKTVSKFAPKLGGKSKKPLTATSKPPDASRPIIANAKQDISMTDQGNSGREMNILLGTESLDNCMRTSSEIGFAETNGASNLSSSGSAAMNCSFQVNEIPEPSNVTANLLTYEVARHTVSEASESKRSLQTDPNKSEHDAMPLMESFDDILMQPSDICEVKQISRFQPKSGSRPKGREAKSVSFSLPDAAETASHVRPLSEVLADDLEVAEPSFTQTMNDELANRTSLSVSAVSDNVDFQSDHGSLRNVDLADISGLESFGSILSEPDSAAGQTVPKFRPKMSTRPKAAKLESFSNTNIVQESTSLRDSLSLGTEQLEGHNLCTPADSSTNIVKEQANHFEMFSLEIGSPGDDDEFETIDIPTDGYTPWNDEQTEQIESTSLGDSLPLDTEDLEGHNLCNPAVSSTNIVNEQANHVEMSSLEIGSPGGDDEFETIDLPTDGHTPWNEEEQTEKILDDQIASKSFEVQGADKSSRKLRKRISVDSTSENLDCGISENWGAENSNDLRMDEDHNNDECKGKDTPKQKEPKRSKRQITDSQKSKRRTKASKEPDSTKAEPPKKRFPHGSRRKRRQVDKVLLETPDDELDHRQLAFRDLIMLAEAKERIASKEAANLNDIHSNTASFSSDSRFDPDNPCNEDLDPDGEEAHRNMLRNSRKFNYQTYMNKQKSRRWSKSETTLFYEAIRQFGSDFEMIVQLFPNRTRTQVKSKFKTEERKHPSEVRDAMMHRSEDHSHFERVIQQLQSKAEEDSLPDNVNDDPSMVSEDAANANQEERGQLMEEELGKAANSEKREECDDDCASLDLDEYESCDWDTGTSFQNEEKNSEYDDIL